MKLIRSVSYSFAKFTFSIEWIIVVFIYFDGIWNKYRYKCKYYTYTYTYTYYKFTPNIKRI